MEYKTVSLAVFGVGDGELLEFPQIIYMNYKMLYVVCLNLKYCHLRKSWSHGNFCGIPISLEYIIFTFFIFKPVCNECLDIKIFSNICEGIFLFAQTFVPWKTFITHCTITNQWYQLVQTLKMCDFQYWISSPILEIEIWKIEKLWIKINILQVEITNFRNIQFLEFKRKIKLEKTYEGVDRGWD